MFLHFKYRFVYFAKNNFVIKLALSIVFILTSAFQLVAQNAKLQLQLVKKYDHNTICYIEEGARICLIDHNGDKFSGILSLPDDSTVAVSNANVPVSDIAFIHSSNAKRIAVKSFGAVLGAAGILLAGAGFSVILDAVSAGSTQSYLILIPLGVIASGIGILTTIHGATLLFGNDKEFDVNKKWNVEIIPVSEIPE